MGSSTLTNEQGLIDKNIKVQGTTGMRGTWRQY